MNPRRRLWNLLNLPLCAAAFVWRHLLRRLTVIAITGSTGKTTAKELLTTILAKHYPVVSTIGNRAGRFGHPRMLLRARPRHRYAITEVGILARGVMWKSALQLRPDIAVILAVKRLHMIGMPTLEIVAEEKGKLLKGLRRGGTMILNADDPRVLAMARPDRFRVRTFGTHPDCDVWADEISARWPARLEFRAHAGDETVRVRTQLVGTHWVPSVLSALTVARECGVSLSESAEAIAEKAPFTARLQPVTVPPGAVILRDEYNGSLETILRALDVLRDATASRRMVVIGQIMDAEERGAELRRMIGRKIAEVAEAVIFLGEYGEEGCQAAVEAGIAPDQAHHFATPKEIAEFLKTDLRRGDLVLLKALYRDHLSRVYFHQLGSVACWKPRCLITSDCDICPQLGFVPAERLTQAH